jgi:hypothetical protein
MPNLNPCPICNQPPLFTPNHNCIDIECSKCALAVSVQKSDLLTLEERATWDDVALKFSDEIEEKVLSLVVSKWNAL